MKKAVVVFYGIKNLYDFIWYYVRYGQDYEWYAICGMADCGNGKYINISDKCKKIGIFKKVIIEEELFANLPLTKKIIKFIEMFLWFIVGKRKRYCEKIVKKSIGDYDYDLAVVCSEYSILNGSLISSGETKKVVILEDGVGDYLERVNKKFWQRIKNINDVAGFFLAKMGYANPQIYFELKTTTYCDKFVQKPEKLFYRNFRSINKLNDVSCMDVELYNFLIEKAFGINNADLQADIVFFTSPLSDFFGDTDVIRKKIEQYINEKASGKKVILKKHIRDANDYQFNKNVCVVELDSSLPAEIFLKNINAEEYLFMFPSNLIMNSEAVMEKIRVLCFEKSGKKNANTRHNYSENFKKSIKCMRINQNQIIDL